jgi:large subunit ribosomal protein L13
MANDATVKKEWVVIDATNLVLGRLSSQVAKILRGKNKPSYTPHVDCGDNVIIINADKVRLTGRKLTNKQYVRHTGYPGGQRFSTPKEMLHRKPIWVIEHAVKVCSPRIGLVPRCSATYTFIPARSTPMRHSNPKKLN